MRKFRTAAVAAATAFSLTIAGTGVAAAEDDAAETNASSSSSFPTSSQIGADKGAWDEDADGNPEIRPEHQVIGTDLLGSSTPTAADGEEGNPQWSEDWKKIAYVGVAGSIIGAIVAGINWLKFQGILPY